MPSPLDPPRARAQRLNATTCPSVSNPFVFPACNALALFFTIERMAPPHRRAHNPFRICSYENIHQRPLLSPLESAFTDAPPVSPLESAFTKTPGGWGGLALFSPLATAFFRSLP
jgi:hypothetical protein